MLDKYVNNIKSGISPRKSCIAAAVILIFLCAAAYIYFNKYFYLFADPKKLKALIMAYGQFSVPAFLVLQMLQVIAFFIPGEIIQIAGGYIFGTFYGTVLSLAGITAGSAVIYGVSSLFGRPMVRRIISKRHLELFEKILQIGSINYVVFLLYLIPGIPKDVLGYICGFSEITFKNFMIYSTLGRIPAIIASAYFGAGILTGSRNQLMLIGVISTLLFIVGVFKGEKLVRSLVGKEK